MLTAVTIVIMLMLGAVWRRWLGEANTGDRWIKILVMSLALGAWMLWVGHPWAGAACAAWVLVWIAIGHGAYGDYGTASPDDEHEVEWLLGWGIPEDQRGGMTYDMAAVAVTYTLAAAPAGAVLGWIGYPLGWVYMGAGPAVAMLGLAAWTWPDRLPRGPWLDGPGAYLELAVGALVVGGLAAVVAP